MILIRSHRFTGPIALFLAVALVIAIAPGMATTVQAADGGTAVLLLPAADESGSEFSDLGEMTTNKLQAAVGSVEGMDVTEFHATSPLVRRAISEGRLLSGQVEVEVGDVAGAIEIGHKLGMDGILLATIKSVDVHSSVRYLTVTLKGEYFEVKSNYDEAAGQPSSALWPEKSFTVTGISHPRANYTGSDRPLVREALDDAVTKFAEVMAGTPAGELAAKPRESEKTSKWKWLGPLLVLGLVAFIVGSSGGGDDGPAPGAAPPVPDHLQVTDYSITLYWDPPPPTDLTLLRYQIQRSTNNSGYLPVDVGTCGTSCTQWTDFDVAAGDIYRYRIRAIYSNSQASEWREFNAVNFP
jgi:hypothetical protein